MPSPPCSGRRVTGRCVASVPTRLSYSDVCGGWSATLQPSVPWSIAGGSIPRCAKGCQHCAAVVGPCLCCEIEQAEVPRRYHCPAWLPATWPTRLGTLGSTRQNGGGTRQKPCSHRLQGVSGPMQSE